MRVLAGITGLFILLAASGCFSGDDAAETDRRDSLEAVRVADSLLKLELSLDTAKVDTDSLAVPQHH